jgi:pyruvate,water dikinase
MKWFRDIFQTGRGDADADLQAIQDKFTHFLALLDQNNRVLKILADMEEKSQGEYLFDLNYIRAGLAEVRSGVREIIGRMIALGGEPYAPLRDRFADIDAEIEDVLRGQRPIEEDDYAIPFDRLDRERVHSVGSKNAQLGEMKKLGLPAPEGFAISAWAYKHFVDANSLQALITEHIRSLDFNRYEDLVRVSGEIREMVTASPVPQDLAEALQKSYAELEARSHSGRVALRSSALGEDTLFSFAGQYTTFLNMRGDELVERYRDILASKFTPQAIYYFLSHALSESELAMGVCCLAMVDASASGVIYTRDPVRPEDGCVLVSSIYGLGKYLVDGTLTPDLFRISRNDRRIVEVHLAKKPVRLVMRPEGGIIEEPVPEAEQEAASIEEEVLRSMAEYAVKLEDHYGSPQDIEWALDRDGRLFLLQTRPLRVVSSRAAPAIPDVSRLELLKSGGTTVCPGAGSGPVFHTASMRDLAGVPEGAVLVAPHSFPGLVTVMGKLSALVIETGGVASHAATLAREYRLPTLVGVERVRELPAGRLVTVDATGAAIYAGRHPELMEARRPEFELFDDTSIFRLLQRVLTKLSPLNMLHPADPNFTPENCRTFHDITRFAHQKAMEEMFSRAKNMEQKDRLGLRLKSDLPLHVNIIYLDQELPKKEGKRWIEEDAIASIPMKAFWSGMKQEGWPSKPPPGNVGGFMSVLKTRITDGDRQEFSESSFAILSQEYMILSLRMGYHFSTVESMCTSEPSKNYIRMQHKGGGASLERRIRRIRVITDLLARMGFEPASQGDFLDAAVSYLDSRAIAEKLRMLGRITLITKQLDMALSSDALAQWYTQDFLKKLGLGEDEVPAEPEGKP